MMFYEDHGSEVFFQPGRSDYLVITFSELTQRPNGRTFWGSVPLQHLGIPAVGFVAKRARWFADTFVRRALAAARPKMEGYARRITYGFSMGAYGATRHAGVLGAQTTIACSPQWTIEPAKLQGIGQPFARHFREDKHVGMELTSYPADGRLYLLYDPYDRHDAWHADRISEHIAQTVRVPMPFVGHGSVRPFANTTLMALLIEAARSHDDELVRRAARHARRKYSGREELVMKARAARSNRF